MVMDMDNIRFVLPFAKPITNGYLERSEPFCVVIIAIDSFPVKQSVDVNKVKIEAKFVCLFFNNIIIEPMRTQVLARLMNKFPLIFIQKFSAVHRHDHFGKMSLLCLV